MSHLSILGTGNMGQAIASVAAKGGHTVQLLGQADTGTAITGESVSVEPASARELHD